MLALPTTTTRGATADELMGDTTVSIDGRDIPETRYVIAPQMLALTFKRKFSID
jgi:hypothetical protein